MQQDVKFSEAWHIMWFFAGADLISNTQTHIAHSGASRLTHPHKYIFKPTVMGSQQLVLLHWMNNSLISKICFPQCLFFSKIRCYKTRFLLWNINNTDRNGENKQNTIHNTGYKNKWYPLFFKTTFPILPTLCFYGKNLNPAFFKNFENSKNHPPPPLAPPSPFKKRGFPTMKLYQ